MTDTDGLGLENLCQYSITIGVGFAILTSPSGHTTHITDPELLETLIELGVKYAYCSKEAGLFKTNIGHKEVGDDSD